MPDRQRIGALAALDEYYPAGAAYGVGSPAEMAQQPAGLGSILSAAYNNLGETARRAFGASELMRTEGPYDPRPGVAAALTAMTGGVGGTAGEGVALGSGPIRRGVLNKAETALERATDQGFDTSQPVYHGTSKDADFSRFKDSRHGTWTTTDPAEASSYAAQNDSMGYDLATMTAKNRASRVIPLYAKPLENPFVVGQTGDVPDVIRTTSNYKKAQSEWFDQLKRQGHDGVIFPGGVRVDFNNANLRSTLAPFDPKNAGRSVIFGSGPVDPRAAMGAIAAQDRYDRRD